jgi:hypothetical protein
MICQCQSLSSSEVASVFLSRGLQSPVPPIGQLTACLRSRSVSNAHPGFPLVQPRPPDVIIHRLRPIRLANVPLTCICSSAHGTLMGSWAGFHENTELAWRAVASQGRCSSALPLATSDGRNRPICRRNAGAAESSSRCRGRGAVAAVPTPGNPRAGAVSVSAWRKLRAVARRNDRPARKRAASF